MFRNGRIANCITLLSLVAVSQAAMPQVGGQEAELVAKAKEMLAAKTGEFPVLRHYLDNWTDFASM